MPSEAEIAELEAQWKAEGVAPDEIGPRLRALIEREQAAADAPQGDAQATSADVATPGPPEDAWPLCPVCGGNGRVPPELAPSSRHRTCPDCNGLGKVATGSLVADHAIRDCARCGGYGYIDLPLVEPQPAENEWARRY